MKLDDSKAGKIGRCLQCNQKFRVPVDTGIDARHPSVSKSSNGSDSERLVSIPKAPSPSARPAEPPPPKHDAELMNRSGYEIEKIDRPTHARKGAVDDDWAELAEVDSKPTANRQDHAEEDEAEPVRPGPAKRRRLSGPQKQDLITGLAIAAIVWIGLTVLAIWVRPVVFVLLILGGVVIAAGRRMLLHLAEQEGTSTWLACLLVPFYPTYFFFTRIHEAYKSFLVSCAGYVFFVSGLALFFMPSMFRYGAAEEPDEPVPIMSVLRLQVDGKEVPMTIERFYYFSVKRGRTKFPDYFLIQGRGLGIFGKTWVGFEEQWDELLNKPLEITPEDPKGEEGDSHIRLTDKGDFQVVKGKLTVKEVVGKTEGDPFLRGDIELELKNKNVKQPLIVRGTFEAQVTTVY
jgi:hypothetical protein